MHTLAIFLVCVPAIALAAPATDAEQQFDRGRALLAAGKIAEACAAFDTSQQLAPAITTRLNQANCRELANQLATAHALFQAAEQQTRDAADESGRRYHKLALERAARLAPALSTVTLTTPAIAGLEIRRNGIVVDPSTYNRAVPIDGGTYTLEVTAPDREPWRTTFAVGAARDHVDVLIPAPSSTGTAPLAIVQPAVTVVATQPAKRVAWKWFAVAGALTVGAVGSEVWARSDFDKGDHHAGKREQYFAIGLGSLGAVAAGVAIYKSTRGQPLARIGKLDLEPALTPTHAGLSLSRRY